MGKKTGVFEEGQHVFARIRGHPFWPACITKMMSKHKYSVYFYGTGETGSVKSEDLDPYDEKNIARYNTERNMKKPEYKEAVDQIQAALAGNFQLPIPLNDAPAVNESNADSIAEETSADETELRIAEDIPAPVVVAKKRPAITKPKQEPLEVPTPVTTTVPEAKENDEKISRSGRKIKEKKMNMDEMDPDEMFKPNALKRFKLDLTKPKQTVLTESNSIEEFRASKMHILQDPVKKAILETQFDLIHAIQDIKLALGLADADVDRSIELLEQLDTKILPQVTRLMLLKYPNILDTVKRLRKYIGNLHSWELEEDQIKEFNTKAEKIRLTAISVYDKLKALFEYSNDPAFWTKFADEQKAFNDKYSTLSPSDIFEAQSVEELDSFVNNHATGAVDNQQPPEELLEPTAV